MNLSFLLKNSVFFVLFFIISFGLFSQNQINFYDSTKHFFKEYIESYEDSLSVQFQITGKYNQFQINAEDNDQNVVKSMKFHPNERTNIGFGFDYKWFGLSLGFSPGSLNNDGEKFGHTDQFDFQINFYSRKFIVDGHFQIYKGYYIENPSDFNSTGIFHWSDSLPYPQRSDVQTITTGMRFNYINNSEKYSYRASFAQTEAQRKSAGSLIFGGFFSLFSLQGDSNLVGFPVNNYFNDTNKIVNAGIFSYGVSVGYVYTFVIKKHFFFTFSLAPGLALQSSNFVSRNHVADIKKFGVDFNTQARFAIGYNGSKYYFGLAAVSDNYLLTNSKTSQLAYSLGNFKLYFGHWFNAEKLKMKWKKKNG